MKIIATNSFRTVKDGIEVSVELWLSRDGVKKSACCGILEIDDEIIPDPQLRHQIARKINQLISEAKDWPGE